MNETKSETKATNPRGRGRPCKCKSCALITTGVNQEPFCPRLNMRVDPGKTWKCGGEHYVRGDRPVMLRHITREELSRKNSENARKVKHHRGGRPKMAPELLMEPTTSINVRKDDAKKIREWAHAWNRSIVSLMHEIVDREREYYDY